MNVLLVWEIVPENIEFYMLEGVTDTELQKLKNINGHLMNNVDDDKVCQDLEYVNMSLDKPEYKNLREDAMKDINFNPEKYGQWYKYKMDFNKEGFNIKDADIMITSGFLL